MSENLRPGFLRMESWRIVWEKCIFDTEDWWNIKISEEKNELIGLHFVDTQAWSRRRPWQYTLSSTYCTVLTWPTNRKTWCTSRDSNSRPRECQTRVLCGHSGYTILNFFQMPRFSNFLRNLTIHFRMFLYLVTCFLRVTVLLLCRSQDWAISSPFTNLIGIYIGTCIYDTACNRHSNETVTLRKHVSEF